MKILNGISEVIDRVFRVIVMITVAIMGISIVAQVFCRYVLNSPLVWSEELARYAMVWMTFYGVSVALRQNSLARVDIFVDMLSAKGKKIVLLIADFMVLFVSIVVLVYSVRLVMEPSVQNQVSPALRLPMQLIYSCMPIGMAGVVYQSALGLVHQLFPSTMPPQPKDKDEKQEVMTV